MQRGDEDATELFALRERVYGPGLSGLPTEDDVARLSVLEAAQSGLQVAGNVGAESAAAPPDSVLQPEREDSTPELPAKAPSRWRLLFSIAAISVLCVALGFGVGAAVFAPRPGSDTLPEFTRPQTEEDVLVGLDEQNVDAASTRFVARLAGMDIYLARPSEFDGVCLLTTVPATGTPSSMGCSDGDQLGSGISSTLTIRLRALADLDPQGAWPIWIRFRE